MKTRRHLILGMPGNSTDLEVERPLREATIRSLIDWYRQEDKMFEAATLERLLDRAIKLEDALLKHGINAPEFWTGAITRKKGNPNDGLGT